VKHLFKPKTFSGADSITARGVDVEVVAYTSGGSRLLNFGGLKPFAKS